jgi:hypothetical protein
MDIEERFHRGIYCEQESTILVRAWNYHLIIDVKNFLSELKKFEFDLGEYHRVNGRAVSLKMEPGAFPRPVPWSFGSNVSRKRAGT